MIHWAPDGRSPIRNGRGYRFDHQGWIYLHIEGEPYERGFQHGYLIAAELQEILGGLDYLTYWKTGMRWEFFVAAAERMFVPHIDQEFLEEIWGVAAGARAAGANLSWQEVLVGTGARNCWNIGGRRRRRSGTLSGARPGSDHCSAFIATGTASESATPGADRNGSQQLGLFCECPALQYDPRHRSRFRASPFHAGRAGVHRQLHRLLHHRRRADGHRDHHRRV